MEVTQVVDLQVQSGNSHILQKKLWGWRKWGQNNIKKSGRIKFVVQKNAVNEGRGVMKIMYCKYNQQHHIIIIIIFIIVPFLNREHTDMSDNRVLLFPELVDT